MSPFTILACANVLDIMTGWIKAIETKTLSSKAMKHGIVSKLFIWAMVLVGGMIKYGLGEYLSIDVDPVPLIICYYLVMELVSIVENISEYLPIPKKIKNLLDQYSEEDN